MVDLEYEFSKAENSSKSPCLKHLEQAIQKMNLRLHALEKDFEIMRQSVVENISTIHDRVENIESGRGSRTQRADIPKLKYIVRSDQKNDNQTFKNEVNRDIEGLREIFQHDISRISIEIDSINKDLYELNRAKSIEKRRDAELNESVHKTKGLKKTNKKKMLQQDDKGREEMIGSDQQINTKEFNDPEPKSELAKVGHKVIFERASELNERSRRSELVTDRGRPRSSDSRTIKTSPLCVKSRDKV